MSDFDAKLEGFIRQHLDQCIAKSERITGGMVNYTFRLYLNDALPAISSENSNDDRLLALVHQLKPKSLIIKVGFPYVVELGESVPFPIIRQQVEERVLNLFTDWSSYATDHQTKSANLSLVSARNKTIKIARAWFCDEINNVLVMDDHGSLPNMEQWFATHKSSSNIEPIIAASQLYGKQMGSFLVDMQVSSLPHMEHLDKLLFGRELQKLDLSDYGDMFEHLREPYNLSDADDLRSIFMQWYEYDASRESTDGKVLAHGDLWAPNFLINQEDLTLAMVDWECATVRSPAHDPALLLGRFQILMASAPANGPVNSFINAFIDSYRESANKLGVSWYKNERDKYLFAWYLGIMYAVSMMFWSMIKSCCSDGHEICSHRRAIVSQGAKYLKECRVGPGKVIYDVISHDPFLGRLFQEPIVGGATSH